MERKAIIVAGNITDGFRFFGPYEDFDAACQASEQLDLMTWIATLETLDPKEPNYAS